MKNTQKRENHQNSTYEFFFLQNHTKMKMEKIAFCAITFDPIKIQTHSAPWQFVSALFFSPPSTLGK